MGKLEWFQNKLKKLKVLNYLDLKELKVQEKVHEWKITEGIDTHSVSENSAQEFDIQKVTRVVVICPALKPKKPARGSTPRCPVMKKLQKEIEEEKEINSGDRFLAKRCLKDAFLQHCEEKFETLKKKLKKRNTSKKAKTKLKNELDTLKPKLLVARKKAFKKIKNILGN